MAETIRFRPVILGTSPGGRQVFYVAERPDGCVFFRDLEWPWLLEGSLDSITPAHLPDYYRQWEAEIRILPVQTASGRTYVEADADLARQIEALASGGTQALEVKAARAA